MNVKRDHVGTGPFVDTILTPLIRLENMPERITERPLYTSAVDGVYHQVFPHDPKSMGDWAMLSLITLSDEVGNTSRVYEDNRKRLTSRHWIAYCFRDKELYVVKDDPERVDWKIYQRLKNAISTSSGALPDFAEIRQYSTILNHLAVNFFDRFQYKFHTFFERTLPYAHETNTYRLLQKWENKLREEYKYFYELVSSAMVIRTADASIFSDKLKCLVQKPVVHEDIELKEEEDKGFSKELYSRLSDKKMGSRLKVLREIRGRTQGEVAEVTGKTQAQLSKIEAGESEPGVKLLLMLSEIYGCSLDILTGDPLAEMVGRHIWIGCRDELMDGIAVGRYHMSYTRYKAIGYDPVPRTIFVAPSELKQGVTTALISGSFKAALIHPQGVTYKDISAYSLVNAIVGTVEGTSEEGQEDADILFIPGIYSLTFVEAMGVEGYNGTWCTKKMKDPRLKGLKFFDGSGKLIVSNV